MNKTRLAVLASGAAVALAGLSAPALAGPHVTFGLYLGGPAYVAPRPPVVYAPPPAYYPQSAYYPSQPAYYPPQPVYRAPAPYYSGAYYGRPPAYYAPRPAYIFRGGFRGGHPHRR